MQQLKMIRMPAPVRERPLPAGYTYASFGGSEEEIADWLILCREGLIPDTDRHWFVDSIEKYPDLDPMRDVIFVLDPDGKRVATNAAVLHANGHGYIHMVATLPACRGKGIGHAMLARALSDLQARGSGPVYLTTDDFRIAAICNYLDAGFIPCDNDTDMKERWTAILEKLNRPIPAFYPGDFA